VLYFGALLLFFVYKSKGENEMVEKLTQILEQAKSINTHGEDTIVMAQLMVGLITLINEEKEKETKGKK